MENVDVSVNEEEKKHENSTKNNGKLGTNKKKNGDTINLDVSSIDSAETTDETENLQRDSDISNSPDVTVCDTGETPEKLSCNTCNEEYEIFCSKCPTLYRILDNKASYDIENRAPRTMPRKILKLGNPPKTSLGIFTLCTILKDVTFGPLEGLEAGTIRSTWKLKGGRFVVNAQNAKRLNWMQFIRRAKTVDDQNLIVFQFKGSVYYKTNRQIERGDELLVYFGEEHARSKNKAVETYFSPKVQKEMRKVYACTYCCIGLIIKDDLKKHKGICPIGKGVDPLFFDIIHCKHCRMYLNKEEYIEYHRDYCEDKHERAWQSQTLSEKTSEENIDLTTSTKVSNTKRKKNKQDQESKKKCVECSSGVAHTHSSGSN